MEPEYVIVAWFFLSIAVGVLAHFWHRFSLVWFFISLLLTPIVGLLGLLLTRQRSPSQEGTPER
jgi:hypothetical protein